MDITLRTAGLPDIESLTALLAERAGRVVAMCSVQTFISTAEGGPVGMLGDMVVARDFTGAGLL